MAKSFAITTTATEILKADAKGHAQAVFTATNATARPVRGLIRAIALDATKREWLSITGDSERDFGTGATAQCTVNFDAAGVPPGKYPFRLDVASALNPDEDFTEGPTVTVEVGSGPAPTEKKKFPIWIIIVIAALVFLVGAVILFLVLRHGNKPDEVAPTPTPTATPVALTPTPTATPVSTQRIKLAYESIGGNFVAAEGGGGGVVNCNRVAIGAWETFTLIDLNGGTLDSGDLVNIQSIGGYYVVAEGGGGGVVNANRTIPREWETFRIEKIRGAGQIGSGDTISLQAYNGWAGGGGNYVAAEGGGGSVVNANRSAVGAWETFTIHIR